MADVLLGNMLIIKVEIALQGGFQMSGGGEPGRKAEGVVLTAPNPLFSKKDLSIIREPTINLILQ